MELLLGLTEYIHRYLPPTTMVNNTKDTTSTTIHGQFDNPGVTGVVDVRMVVVDGRGVIVVNKTHSGQSEIKHII